MARISLEDVRLSYPVFSVPGRSLKASVMRRAVGARVDDARGAVRVRALDGVTLDASEGDRIGLLGHNGSGKTTLLRVIARVARPESGRVVVEGRVIPLIERGLGVNRELTGRQNIELPIRLLGGTDEEVRAARADIPAWTGLGSFIDLPVRTYSAGMFARLLFALCTAVRGDILVFDEWLGAGDQEFVERANERMASVLDRTAIVVLATHSLDLIRRFCNRVVWMDKGRPLMAGEPADVIHCYANGLRPDADGGALEPAA